MKKFLQLFILIAFSANLFGQSATSIVNGNWTNPLTWNCTCVPFSGYSVTINHSVTLNTTLVINAGGITINNTGSLTQDATPRDIWINGGYFNNNGKANFRYFLVSSGSMTNPGSFTVSAFTNSVAVVNAGNIQMDSMYVAGNFTNTASGKITGDSITNATGNNFTNNGRVSVNWSLNNGTFLNNRYHGGYAFTNAGMYTNNDSILLTGSIWNKKAFNNTGAGRIRITKNFHNYNPSNTSSFNNNGSVIALDSWYNTDTIKGGPGGYYEMADTSANAGIMAGSFTFCDLTPPPTNPKIDFNSGMFSLNVVFCSIPGGINENELTSAIIYPNPSNGTVYFKADSKNILRLSVTDVTGKVIMEKNIKANDEIKVDHAAGIYFMKITDPENGRSVTKKLIIHN